MTRITEWKQVVGKINKEVSNLLDSLIAEGVWEEEKVLLTESQEFTFFAAKTMLDDWKSWKLAQDHPKLLAKTPQFYKGALIQAGTWVHVSDHPAMDKCTAGLFTHAIKGPKGNTMYRVLGVNFDNANNHHLTKFFGQRPDEEWPKQLRESVAIRQDAAERAALLTEAAVGQALEEEKTTTQPILFASTTYDPWGPSNNPNVGWQDTSGTSLYPMLCTNDTLTILTLPEGLSADLAQALEDHNMDKPETETAPIWAKVKAQAAGLANLREEEQSSTEDNEEATGNELDVTADEGVTRDGPTDDEVDTASDRDASEPRGEDSGEEVESVQVSDAECSEREGGQVMDESP